MGLENLSTAIDEGRAQAPQTPEQIKFAAEKLADEVALGIVTADVNNAEKYLYSKALPQDWNTADELYRAYVNAKKWDGTGEERAHLGMPLVMEVVEQLLPQAHLAFFSDKQPFFLDPRGRTTPEAARAASRVLLWAIHESGFKEEIRKILKSALFYGTGVGKWGWVSGKKSRKKYSRGDDGTVQMKQEPQDYSCPTLDYIELCNLLVDPHTRTQDIRNARYVIHQKFIDASELDSLRDSGMYKNVPTRAQLKDILVNQGEPAVDSLAGNKVQNYRQHQAELQRMLTSADPTKQPLELLEYWTEDRVITVLQRKIILRNEENEFCRLPFVSCSFVDVPASFYGFGVAKLLEGEQKFEQGVVNAWIDSLSLSLTPMWQRKNGVGPSNQTILTAPGKVVNDAGELTPFQKESVSFEAIQAIQVSENRARRRVGANFGADMPTQAMRTAEGVQEFTSSLQVKLQYFVENFADMVFIPTLEAFVEMAKDTLSPNQIQRILTDADGKAFDGDVLDIYNGNYSLAVLTSTKLAARRAMAGMLPMMMQLFMAEPVQDSLTQQAKKVNYAELLQQALDLSGWDAPNIIVDMTDEDQQRAMMSNPAVVKAQADAQKQAQQHENNLDLEAAKGDARAGVQVVRSVLKENETPKPAAPLATRGAE